MTWASTLVSQLFGLLKRLIFISEETCSLIYIEGNGTNSTLAFNRTYLRHNTGLITGGDLYITADEPFIYLFYRDGWWLLTDKHEQGFIYAKLEFDDVPVAKLGTQEWLVNSTNKWFHIKANVACACKYWFCLMCTDKLISFMAIHLPLL